jgi:beta-lactamase class A
VSSKWLWQGLEDRVAGMIEGFRGVAGVCVKDLSTRDGFAVRGDELFPTASTIKIHILTRLLLQAERGEIDLGRKIQFTPEMQVPGSGVLTYLEGRVELSVLDTAILMIIVSDNAATNICIDLAGIEATNALLRELGLERTTLRRKMQDHAAVARNEENVATPAECIAMLEHLYEGRPTPGVAERCLSILKKPKKGLLNRAIPPDVPVANKPGGMERVRCDVGIVYLPRHPYAIAVMTKFGLDAPADQENFVVDVVREVHETMYALEASSDYGQGIPDHARTRPAAARRTGTRNPGPIAAIGVPGANVDE